MNFLLATVHDEREAHQRVDLLQRRFPNIGKFVVVPHETRHQIEVQDVTNQLDTPVLDRMVSTAQGLHPEQPTEADMEDPATTNVGAAVGQAGGPPAGGSPATRP